MYNNEELTCRPLDSIEEMFKLLDNPPPWRSLCIEMKPHSDLSIKNISIAQNSSAAKIDSPIDFCHFEPEVKTSISSLPDMQERKKLPKTLVCHDFANGYHDDSFVDGTGNYDAYTFYNWAGVDIFCYFSHHFITIPPLGWINIGHAHGVKVIGTLITEWGTGGKLWEQLLSSQMEWKKFANGLVALAKVLRFDGWLLNIENSVSKPDALVKFVEYLHALLHSELPDSLLIWYDSVTVRGELVWQNALTLHNKAFFDACDGIFTNYSWRAADVASSVALAGARHHDVFVGIDVWGRNFTGGGKFNTCEAIKIVYKYGCSLAIFAPGWTHEAIPKHTDHLDQHLSMFEQFLLRDRAFWSSLWPWLNTKRPKTLPFATSFCRGQGVKRRSYGEVISPQPWYNLRHMQYQPNSNLGAHGYVLATIEDIHKVNRWALDKHDNVTYKEILETIVNKEVAQVANDDQDLPDPESLEKSNFLQKIAAKIDGINRLVDSDKKTKAGFLPIKVSHEVTLRFGHAISAPAEGDRHKIALVKVPGEKECLEVDYSDSFNGGSCLRVNPSDETSPKHRTIRLFHCNFFIKDTLIVCVVTKKTEAKDQYLNILLSLLDSEGKLMRVVLKGGDDDDDDRGMPGDLVAQAVADKEFDVLRKHLLVNEPAFYVPTENSYGWDVRYFSVCVGGRHVTSIDCRTRLAVGPILLGHLALTNINKKESIHTEGQRNAKWNLFYLADYVMNKLLSSIKKLWNKNENAGAKVVLPTILP